MKKCIVGFVSVIIVLLLMPSCLWAADFTVLFTHDTHSHLLSETTNYGGNQESTGGYSRLKTAIDREKEKYPQALLVDAGDFSMGTLFQTIYTTDAAELRMLGILGYDYTTLGNHEFDYRTQGLTDMLYAAAESESPLPMLLTANIDWEATLNDSDLAPAAGELIGALDAVDSKPYEIIEKDGVQVGIFGIIGQQAVEYAPLSGLLFSDPIEIAESVVAEIKEEAPEAVIICLSHSGTSEDKAESEDEQLAEAVTDIDVIVSGHSHTALAEPIRVGDTLIVSAGEYTNNLGSLTFSLEDNEVTDYRLIPLDNSLPEDPSILEEIEVFKELVQTKYLAAYGYGFDDVIAFSAFDFTPIEEFAQEHEEDTLGDLIADSYIYGVAQAEGDSYRQVDVAVVPSGVIRGSFSRGDITVSQIFNVSSLGTGPDGKTGYPLVSVYLTGKELAAVCEIDASVSSLMAEAQLYISGLRFTYNPYRFFLSRVTDVTLLSEDEAAIAIDDDKLYRVVADLYSAQMLGTVQDLSFGLLSLVPKDAEGEVITDFEDHIIRDQEGAEVKAWVSLAGYMSSFSENEAGISQLPAVYASPQGRKTEIADNSLGAILSQPSKVMVIFALIVVFIIVVLIFLIRLIRKRLRRRDC